MTYLILVIGLLALNLTQVAILGVLRKNTIVWRKQHELNSQCLQHDKIVAAFLLAQIEINKELVK